MEILVEVMRRGNFSGVAKARKLDPATVSRLIAAVETELGMRLFQRTTRQLRPTEAGLAYFERIEPLVEALRQANSAAEQLMEAPRGRLKIASPVSFAEVNLVPLLPDFTAQYPHLDLDLVLTDNDLDLVAEHIDAAIVIGALRDKTSVAHRLSDYVPVVCASPEYLQKHGRPTGPTDLAGHKCLSLALRGFAAGQWKFTCRQTEKTKRVRINEHLRTSNAMALKQCALRGMGITLQARWMIGRELREGRLVDLFPEFEVTAALGDVAAWLVHPSQDYLPKKVRVFVDFLRARFRDGPPGDRDPRVEAASGAP
ncbi:MAG: LysR family transcriptional regulator [Candidatus Didemnitutus sp.]|nr:LysR family transcriptional regulator [Candidatus Didemnitutus sp.]